MSSATTILADISGCSLMQKNELILSELPKTWLIDIDGTIVKHNGFLLDGHDTLLPGSRDFINSLPKKDRIILMTAREEYLREKTETFLKQEEVRFDEIIFGLPTGERILINDIKPMGLETAKAINIERNIGIKIKINTDKNL
jgi:uncharacterized HAD superfamily protein